MALYPFLLFLLLQSVSPIQINVTSHHNSPNQYVLPIKSLFNLNSFTAIFHPVKDYFVAFPETRKTGCVQVLTTGFIGKTYCSLPPYCKHTKYSVLESGWFSEIGICYGLSTPVKTLSFNTNFGYGIQLDKTGWCMVGQYKSSRENDFPDAHTNQNIFVIICEDGIYAMSNTTLATYTTIQLHQSNHSYTINYPTPLQSEDGRMCSPRYINHDIPYIVGPFKTEEDLIPNLPLYYETEIRNQTKSGPFKLDLAISLEYNEKLRLIKTVAHVDPRDLECEPYKHTLNILPFSVGSIFATIVHVLELILQWLIDLIQNIFSYLVVKFSEYHLVSLTTLILVAYACVKYGNTYAILAFYLASIFINVAIRNITEP